MGTRGKRRDAENSIDISSDEPILQSAKQVIDLARERGLFNGSSLDVEKVANSMGIEVVKEKLKDNISGKLEINGDDARIVINAEHSRQRQRFTIAHELGHYILHRKEQNTFEDVIFFRGKDMTNIEYSANKFAGDLLMPEDKVRERISSGIKDLRELSSYFDVSVAAMRYRVVNLGYIVKSDGNG